jgi:hypothetical protein
MGEAGAGLASGTAGAEDSGAAGAAWAKTGPAEKIMPNKATSNVALTPPAFAGRSEQPIIAFPSFSSSPLNAAAALASQKTAGSAITSAQAQKARVPLKATVPLGLVDVLGFRIATAQSQSGAFGTPLCEL